MDFEIVRGIIVVSPLGQNEFGVLRCLRKSSRIMPTGIAANETDLEPLAPSENYLPLRLLGAQWAHQDGCVSDAWQGQPESVAVTTW